MGPITYSLCHKEYIGLAMWITGFCAFPPLVPPTEISLKDSGVVLAREFNAPVDKSYLLQLRFVFPSTEIRIKDRLVGDRYIGNHCDSDIAYEAIPEQARRGLGLPIPFKVTVRAEPGGAPVLERTFNTLCHVGHAKNDKYRNVGRFDLSRGTYRIEVHNMEPQPAFTDITIEMSLVSGEAK